MKERPILFSGPMVRAILEGRKTQTRRIVKTDLGTQSKDTIMRGFPIDPKNVRYCGMYAKCDAPVGSRSVSYRVPCPYGWLGDQLWVKETFYCDHYAFPEGENDGTTWIIEEGKRRNLTLEEKRADMRKHLYFRADLDDPNDDPIPEGDGSIKWTPSIFMRRWTSRIALEITMIRVQKLNEISETDSLAEGVQVPEAEYAAGGSAKNAYRSLWESINGVGSWAKNPWVWVIEFKRL